MFICDRILRFGKNIPQSLKRFLSNLNVVAINNSLDGSRITLNVRNNCKPVANSFSSKLLLVVTSFIQSLNQSDMKPCLIMHLVALWTSMSLTISLLNLPFTVLSEPFVSRKTCFIESGLTLKPPSLFCLAASDRTVKILLTITVWLNLIMKSRTTLPHLDREREKGVCGGGGGGGSKEYHHHKYLFFGDF